MSVNVYDYDVGYTFSGTSAITEGTFNVGGSNRVGVVFVAIDNYNLITGVTWDYGGTNQSMTLIDYVDVDGINLAAYGILNPATKTGVTVRATLSLARELYIFGIALENAGGFASTVSETLYSSSPTFLSAGNLTTVSGYLDLAVLFSINGGSPVTGGNGSTMGDYIEGNDGSSLCLGWKLATTSVTSVDIYYSDAVIGAALSVAVVPSSTSYSITANNLTVGSPNVGGTIETAVAFTANTSGGANWSGYTLRQYIPASLTVGSAGAYVAVEFEVGASTSGHIDEAWVGVASGTGGSFNGSQVRLTFNGSYSKAVSANERVRSDPILLNYDPANAYVVTAHYTASETYYQARNNAATGATTYYRSAVNDAATTTASGYSSLTNSLAAGMVVVNIQAILSQHAPPPVAVNLSVSSPVFETPQLIPGGASPLTVSSPVIDSAIIHQVHALPVVGLTVSSISEEQPIIHSVHSLFGESITVAPSFSSPVISQSHHLTISDWVLGYPIFPSTLLHQSYSLLANSLSVSAIQLGHPYMAKLYNLFPISFYVSSPHIDAPLSGEVFDPVAEFSRASYLLTEEDLEDFEEGYDDDGNWVSKEDYIGKPIREAIFTNYNDKLRLKVLPRSLVGCDDDSGVARYIHVSYPLYLENRSLKIDLSIRDQIIVDMQGQINSLKLDFILFVKSLSVGKGAVDLSTSSPIIGLIALKQCHTLGADSLIISSPIIG